MKRILLLLLILYLAGYTIFRQTNQEVWTKDSETYVIFPSSMVALYYLWRPMSIMDSKLTGMRFHIGPHEQ